MVQIHKNHGSPIMVTRELNNEKFPSEDTYFHGGPLIGIHDGDGKK